MLTYRTITTKGGLRDRLVLVGLRLTALAILLFCLFRTVLVLRAAIAQQNFVGILIDDSRSMRITDSDGQPRSAFVQEALGGPDAALYGALADRFALRFFRFSSSTERLATPGDLTFEGTETRLGDALTRAREELAGLPLSALVVLTDGADTTEAPLTEPLLALTAQAIPVFTVGLGRESVQRDVQVSRVATPRAVLKGSTLVVDVVLSQTGYRDTTVPLNVESEGRIVSTQDVRLPADGEPATVRARFTVADAGAHTFKFRVPAQAGEEITQNNVRDVLIEVEDGREKILWFEGEPRFEVGFLRRAVRDDKNVELVVLQRTADNKYLRLGSWELLRSDGGTLHPLSSLARFCGPQACMVVHPLGGCVIGATSSDGVVDEFGRVFDGRKPAGTTDVLSRFIRGGWLSNSRRARDQSCVDYRGAGFKNCCRRVALNGYTFAAAAPLTPCRSASLRSLIYRNKESRATRCAWSSAHRRHAQAV